MSVPLFGELVTRARAAEAAGFVGMTGMDHLAPPLADEQPMYEAIVTTAWLAAHTERLQLGSLVLCDAFRLPALLARQAVSIDRASGGRFELGIGAGSVPDEFLVLGAGANEARDRVARLRESLEIIRALWTGEVVDSEGEFHHLKGAHQQPLPLGRIPRPSSSIITAGSPTVVLRACTPGSVISHRRRRSPSSARTSSHL